MQRISIVVLKKFKVLLVVRSLLTDEKYTVKPLQLKWSLSLMAIKMWIIFLYKFTLKPERLHFV